MDTELDYSWKRNTAFLLLTNSQIVENENASVTRSILGINSYDVIFSNSLVLSVFATGLDWLQPGLNRFYIILIVSS